MPGREIPFSGYEKLIFFKKNIIVSNDFIKFNRQSHINEGQIYPYKETALITITIINNAWVIFLVAISLLKETEK